MDINFEKILSESGIHTLDSEMKQALYLMTIMLKIHQAINDKELRTEVEKYFLKTAKSLNA